MDTNSAPMYSIISKNSAKPQLHSEDLAENPIAEGVLSKAPTIMGESSATKPAVDIPTKDLEETSQCITKSSKLEPQAGRKLNDLAGIESKIDEIPIQLAPLAAYNQSLHNERLQLILEKVDGSFDLEDPFPISHLFDSNIAGFFSWISETSKRPLESLNCITITFIFVSDAYGPFIIHKGEDEHWGKLKENARRLSSLDGPRTDTTDVQIVVECGDKRSKA